MILFILGFSIGLVIGMVIMYLDLRQDLQDLNYWKNHGVGPLNKGKINDKYYFRK